MLGFGHWGIYWWIWRHYERVSGHIFGRVYTVFVQDWEFVSEIEIKERGGGDIEDNHTHVYR